MFEAQLNLTLLAAIFWPTNQPHSHEQDGLFPLFWKQLSTTFTISCVCC